MLYLKKLHSSDGKDIFFMLQEIAFNDNGFHNKVNGMRYDEFKIWLQNEYEVDNGKLEDWMVPQSTYWLFDDGTPVGYGRIRHYLNDSLAETSGHIGYAIAKSQRGKGYGNAILALLKDEAKKLGIAQLQIGAKSDNERSNKVIIANGGILFREKNGKNFYHINLTE